MAAVEVEARKVKDEGVSTTLLAVFVSPLVPSVPVTLAVDEADVSAKVTEAIGKDTSCELRETLVSVSLPVGLNGGIGMAVVIARSSLVPSLEGMRFPGYAIPS